jgi:hypothetical protein
VKLTKGFTINITQIILQCQAKSKYGYVKMHEACPKSKHTSIVGRWEIFYAYCGNTAVNLDPLPVSRARLTVIELALFEGDVFEMVAPIQSPAKCEVRSVIRFLNATSAVKFLTRYAQEGDEFRTPL